MMSKKQVMKIMLIGGLIVVAGVCFFLRHGSKGEPTGTLEREHKQIVSKAAPKQATSLPSPGNTNDLAVEEKEARNAVNDSYPMGEVEIAGTNIGVRFEVKDISPELKQAILDDIELNTSHFKYFRFRSVHYGRDDGPNRYFDTEVTYLLDEDMQEELFPEVFNDYFGYVCYTNGTYQLLVHEKLVEAYREALDYKRSHPIMFQRLDEFLSKLKSPELLESVAQDEDISMHLFYSEHGYPEKHECRRAA